jgi:hypothetical protein
MPNDKLGRVWVTPSQLIEGKTLTEWFPLNTDGEIKLNIFSFGPIPLSSRLFQSTFSFSFFFFFFFFFGTKQIEKSKSIRNKSFSLIVTMYHACTS